MSDPDLPDGVDFIWSGDDVVGVTFPKNRDLTPEEVVQLNNALAEVSLPPIPEDAPDDPYLWESGT